MGKAPQAALGFRTHSGWALVVAVAGSVNSPQVIERRRIELADPKIEGSKQPYHAAEDLKFNKAEELVWRCIESSRTLAWLALRSLVADLRQKGHEITGCGILLGSGKPLPELAAILSSHALIHAAEGEMFREVVAHAGKRCDLPLTGVRERELFAEAIAALKISEEKVKAHLSAIGKTIGPPWRQDEKYAAVAGWMALARAPKQ